MTRRYRSTRVNLENMPGKYPSLVVRWTEDEDGLGWEGIAQKFAEEGKVGNVHTVSLRQTLPIGGIVVTFDGSVGGYWKTARFEGTRLDERDLQWATAWAVLALEDKERFFTARGKRGGHDADNASCRWNDPEAGDDARCTCPKEDTE